VEINVGGGGSSGAAYDFAANACSASWFSTAGNLPCPGTDGDPRGFVLKLDNPRLEDGSQDTGSGLLTNPRNIFNGDIHGKYPEFHVQHGDRFQAKVNCDYHATGCYVTFRLDYQMGNGPIYTLWAFREKYEGLYYRVNLDLDSLAGRDVKFILTVLATGPAGDDRAVWSNPQIVRLGPPSPPPAPTGCKFDFGTSSSPVASGYTRVTESTAYSGVAYPNPSSYPCGNSGWTSTTGLESRDRSAPADDLKRDFVMHTSAARTFRGDLPNGNYAVTVLMGDNDFAHDNMVVKANGATMLGDVDTAVGAFASNTFNVNVSTGRLDLEFSDAGGGSDPTWIVNAVTVLPSFGPPPGPGCDRAAFVTDVTVPDGTVFAPGEAFVKTWRLKNVGTCTWTTSYKLVFISGEQMGGPSSQNLPTSVPPGGTVDVSVNLTAPASPGTYNGFWKFENASSQKFGIGADGSKSWYVQIQVSGPSVTPSAMKFDFGTSGSPVASGYTRVTEATAYSAGTYGWTDTSLIQSRDRGAPADELNRDLALNDSGGIGTFNVDLPNGSYSVTVRMGDHDYAHDNVQISADGGGGSSIVVPDVDTAANTFVDSTFKVDVTGGSLTLAFVDTGGGTDPSWVVNAITIGNKFDFGLSSSPAVATGYTEVTELTAFTTALGYGWADTSIIQARDRGAPADALKQDFAMNDSGGAGTFKVALLNGSYSVAVTMGDHDYAHDNMIVKANGGAGWSTVAPDVDAAADEYKVTTFSVTVTGGLLQLQFSDPDVSPADPTWVVNGVTIGP
jgi:fibronectin type 3 domain-containing protein